MKKSIEVFQKNELPNVGSLLTPNDAELNLRQGRLAGLRQNISDGKQSANYIQLEGELKRSLESYKDKAKAFIQIFEEIYEEVKKVDTHISLFVENHLPKLADLTSVWIRNEPESTISPIDWENLPQELPSMGLKQGNQVDSFKAFSSRERIIPEDIVDMINERRISDVATELNRILRKLHSLSMNVDGSGSGNELSLASRVLLETHIFQALNFFYENQLCDQKVLRRFFSTENTLERTYEHMRDLFNRRRQRGEDLDKEEQARLVELMLIGAIERFKQSFLFRESSPEIRTIIHPVTNDRILKHWWLNDSPNSMEQESVKEWISKLVTFFGETGDSNKRFEYLISYYLLSFIKTYQIRDLTTLQFSHMKENILLDTKYELFQAGIRLHESSNRYSDYVYLVRLQSDHKDYLTTDITAEMVESARIEMFKREDEYKFFKGKLAKMAKDDRVLSGWIRKHFFIKFYDTFPSLIERGDMWSYQQLPLYKTVSDRIQRFCSKLIVGLRHAPRLLRFYGWFFSHLTCKTIQHYFWPTKQR
ncbi:hypothetical protein O181_096489 [Austropuccinia psidii MF-1]|uniref:Uncharacterized protein n=1 Tax=Austropuccinia psidii MF-1 TaxID=1389203 RepID=A0A9Q3PCQ5_9BASI|nr:hypothetical protein [Austropuccinia psidii MF-1]